MKEEKCACCGQSIESILMKTKDGRYNWSFNWQEGGFNNEWAKTKKQAIKQAEAGGHKLKVNAKTLRRMTERDQRDFTRMGNMMCM